MGGKSLEQRMADTEVRIRQLQAMKKSMEQAIRQQDRKERTRRLIKIGGIMARLGIDSVEKAQAFQREVERRPEVKTWINGVVNKATQSTPTCQQT